MNEIVDDYVKEKENIAVIGTIIVEVLNAKHMKLRSDHRDRLETFFGSNIFRLMKQK